MTLIKTDTQHIIAPHYAECHYAECRALFIVILSVIMLNVVMLNVVMLNAIMLSVVAPFKQPFLNLILIGTNGATSLPSTEEFHALPHAH